MQQTSKKSLSNTLPILVTSLILAACGGGGSSEPQGVPPANGSLTSPIAAKATSYANKNSMSGQLTMPAYNSATPFYRIVGNWAFMAIGTADFFQTGSNDMFTAIVNYESWTPSQYTRAVVDKDPSLMSDFKFWHRNTDGTLVELWTAKGCLHPRKAAIADFNKDGYPDVFVACTGWDSDEFPGETNRLVLSDGKGGFTVKEVGPVAYTHTASAADINGDGYPDVVVAGMGFGHWSAANPQPTGDNNTTMLMNNKDGTFTVDNTRIPMAKYSGGHMGDVELVDVDGDGYIDFIGGTHGLNAWSPPAAIYYGNKDGYFTGRMDVIPAVVGRSVMLDFILTNDGGKRGMYIGRTSDGLDTLNDYATTTVQYLDLSTMKSTVLLDSINNQTGRGNVVPFWIPAVRNGVSGIVPIATDYDYGHWFVTNK